MNSWVLPIDRDASIKPITIENGEESLSEDCSVLCCGDVATEVNATSKPSYCITSSNPCLFRSRDEVYDRRVVNSRLRDRRGGWSRSEDEVVEMGISGVVDVL